MNLWRRRGDGWRLSDALKSAHLAAGLIWAPVFFLFAYPFMTLSHLTKLRLEHKRLELKTLSETPAGETEK